MLELPEEPLDAEADGDKLRQILANLVDNAVKFSPNGGKVTVAARRAGEEVVEVRVVDEGIGIPEEERARLFDRFFRASTAVRQQIPGTGLGLYIARAIVEAHGGSIDVESADGQGTTFCVDLPARRQ